MISNKLTVETNCDITYATACGTQADKRRADTGSFPGRNAGTPRRGSRKGREAGRSVTGSRQTRNRAARAGRPASPHTAEPPQIVGAAGEAIVARRENADDSTARRFQCLGLPRLTAAAGGRWFESHDQLSAPPALRLALSANASFGMRISRTVTEGGAAFRNAKRPVRMAKGRPTAIGRPV